jgi:hypothetical protein
VWDYFIIYSTESLSLFLFRITKEEKN